MAQLWGGRFTKETDKLVYNFNASISFDQKFYEQDIRGSKAHVAMLAKQGILTEEEKIQIENGLDGILADVKSGKSGNHRFCNVSIKKGASFGNIHRISKVEAPENLLYGCFPTMVLTMSSSKGQVLLSQPTGSPSIQGL